MAGSHEVRGFDPLAPPPRFPGAPAGGDWIPRGGPPHFLGRHPGFALTRRKPRAAGGGWGGLPAGLPFRLLPLNP